MKDCRDKDFMKRIDARNTEQVHYFGTYPGDLEEALLYRDLRDLDKTDTEATILLFVLKTK